MGQLPQRQLRPRGRPTSSTSAGRARCCSPSSSASTPSRSTSTTRRSTRMQPATSVRAAYLAALTKRVKILVAGVPINLSWPSRVAEEYAMLDVMSNGRMEYGFPLGTGMEYWSNAGQLNPTTARARFRENLVGDPQDVDRGRPGPPRRRVLQLPLPQRVAAADAEAAPEDLHRRLGQPGDRRRGHRLPRRLLDRLHADRAAAQGDGQLPRGGRGQGLDGPAGRHHLHGHLLRRRHRRGGGARGAPAHREVLLVDAPRARRSSSRRPGYVSRSEFLRRAQSAALADGTRATWDDMVSIGRIICGSPDTVADTLVALGAGGAVQPHAHGPPARRHARVEGRQEHAHVRQGGHPAGAGRGRAAARRPRSWRG